MHGQKNIKSSWVAKKGLRCLYAYCIEHTEMDSRLEHYYDNLNVNIL